MFNFYKNIFNSQYLNTISILSIMHFMQLEGPRIFQYHYQQSSFLINLLLTLCVCSKSIGRLPAPGWLRLLGPAECRDWTVVNPKRCCHWLGEHEHQLQSRLLILGMGHILCVCDRAMCIVYCKVFLQILSSASLTKS